MSTESLYQVEWNRVFNMVSHNGKELNSRKNRFDKAELIETSIEYNSGGGLKFVDLKGYDHVCSETGTKFEIKSQQCCLYTEKRGDLKPCTPDIKLNNTLGGDLNSPFDSEFDYLVLVDTGNNNTFAVAYISREKLEPYMTRVSDGWKAKIPTKDLEFVFTPEDRHYTPQSSSEALSIPSYAKQKRALMSEHVSCF